MADAKEAAPAASAPTDSGGGGSNKILFGMLGLNLVVVIAVAVVLVLGQKKQAQVQTLEQVAEGHESGGGEHGEAKAEKSEGGGEHGGGGGGEHGGGGGGEHAAGDARFFSVGNFTANLSGPASAHYIAADVSFELSKDADEEEFKQRAPQFRDRVISLMNSKKPADLQTGDGRDALKEEIKTVVNGLIKKGKVEGVYFSKFVIN